MSRSIKKNITIPQKEEDDHYIEITNIETIVY